MGRWRRGKKKQEKTRVGIEATYLEEHTLTTDILLNYMLQGVTL